MPNGSIGIIKSMTPFIIDINNKEYKFKGVGKNSSGKSRFTPAYGLTVHKAQGITVDKAYVMTSKGFNQHITYVAMSRHIKDVNLYWSRDEFGSFSNLKNHMSREARKENAMDYIDSAKEYAKDRGIESTYKDIDVKNNEFHGERWKERMFNANKIGETYESIMERLEGRREYNSDVVKAKQFYGKELNKELKAGEHLRFVQERRIGKEDYALFRVSEGGYRMMNMNRCADVREGEQVTICKATDGQLMASPSKNALWGRKVNQLGQEFGKEVSFDIGIGDRGKYGGTIEFEGKRYGVMHQLEQVKLIDKRDFAEDFKLKDGGYMKIEQYHKNKDEIIAVVDTEKYKEIEEVKQQQIERQMERSKGKDFEIEM